MDETTPASRSYDLTTVYITQGLLRAQVIKAKLEEAGIPVLLKYESAGPAIGIVIDGLGEVRVLVPSEYAAEARMLLEERGPEEEATSDATSTADC